MPTQKRIDSIKIEHGEAQHPDYCQMDMNVVFNIPKDKAHIVDNHTRLLIKFVDERTEEYISFENWEDLDADTHRILY